MGSSFFTSKTLYRIVIAVFVFFIFYSLYFLIGLNFHEALLTDSNFFGLSSYSGAYYKEAITHHLRKNQNFLNFHVSSGILLLVIGFSQINGFLRQKSARYHRILGYVYFILGTISVSLGTLIAHLGLGGLTAQVGFYAVSILWTYSAFKAIGAAKKKQFKEHACWVKRNFVLALFVGLMRPVMVTLATLYPGSSHSEIFATAIWISCLSAVVVWSRILPSDPIPN
jgi:uncharacterized membrane protein